MVYKGTLNLTLIAPTMMELSANKCVTVAAADNRALTVIPAFSGANMENKGMMTLSLRFTNSYFNFYFPKISGESSVYTLQQYNLSMYTSPILII